MRQILAGLTAFFLVLSLSACTSGTPAPTIGEVATLSPQTTAPETLPPQTLSPGTLAPETQTDAPETQTPEPAQPESSAPPQAPEPTQAPDPTAQTEPTPQPELTSSSEPSAPPQIMPGGAVFRVPGTEGEPSAGTTESVSAGHGAQSDELDAMSLADVMAAVLKDVSDLPDTQELELESDRYEFTAFVPYSDGMQALVSEPMINAVAHSVVLLRVPEGADATQVADTMAANMNPRKWICVCAEASSVTVRGRTILLVMSNEAAEKQIVDNFNAL